ncbi:hypothetical protein PAXINDRAFT_104094 [Paxillus involutus ATCC 200175]|jgi:hypothetical protein|uniref:Uncharacterized protein n=1 Tax=Paxillus involutus ATCC 200175 TaxID=664439 RepID=A0A0C9SZQ3_PAXIN|nr:hypothetical protein PAXINDRAFT_104094 [Paxillus involutus ATCC 200175]
MAHQQFSYLYREYRGPLPAYGRPTNDSIYQETARHITVNRQIYHPAPTLPADWGINNAYRGDTLPQPPWCLPHNQGWFDSLYPPIAQPASASLNLPSQGTRPEPQRRVPSPPPAAARHWRRSWDASSPTTSPSIEAPSPRTYSSVSEYIEYTWRYRARIPPPGMVQAYSLAGLIPPARYADRATFTLRNAG